MAKAAWLKPILLAAFAVYPLLVYFGLSVVGPRWLLLLLLFLVVIRTFFAGQQDISRTPVILALIVVVFVSLLSGYEAGLLLYPALVSIGMFALFARSYCKPPTVIELMARRFDKEFTDQAIPYTRRVTLVWMAFFVVNAGVAVYTIFLSRESWALYNGLIAYLLMALIMGVEVLVRRQVKKRHAQ